MRKDWSILIKRIVDLGIYFRSGLYRRYYSKLIPSIGITNWRVCNTGINTLRVENDGIIIGCLPMQDYI